MQMSTLLRLGNEVQKDWKASLGACLLTAQLRAVPPVEGNSRQTFSLLTPQTGTGVADMRAGEKQGFLTG